MSPTKSQVELLEAPNHGKHEHAVEVMRIISTLSESAETGKEVVF